MSIAQSVPSNHFPPACGPNNQEFSVHKESAPAISPQISQGAARLIIFSESYGLHSACGPVTRLGLDGKWIGANCLGSYTSIEISPGNHHLCANTQAQEDFKYTALQSFSAEPGRTYYFRATMILGLDPEAAMHMEALNGDEGAFLISSWKISKALQK